MDNVVHAKTSNRLTELDGLRGALLLLMTVNHMPSPLRNWTSQPLGFTSAAEGFVFLSAFLAGLIFHRRSAKVGVQSARESLIARSGVVLRAHYITFGLVFAVIGLWLAPMMPEFKNMVWPMVDKPTSAMLLGGLLMYQPSILDVLPLYVLLLVLTPAMFWLAERYGWRWLIAGSALLWALSQHAPLKLKLLDLLNLGHPWDFGYFDQFAWQFLWVLGLGLGTWYFRKPADKPLIDWSRPAVKRIAIAGWILMVYLFVARHQLVGFNLESWWWTLDKWRLGPLRMISFALHVGLFIALAGMLRPVGMSKALRYLGEHSMPVFCGHIAFALLATGFAEHFHFPDAIRYALVALAIGGLYLAAYLSTCPYWTLAYWRELLAPPRDLVGRPAAGV